MSKHILKVGAMCLAILAIAGCEKSAQSVQKIGSFDVETLFVKDGCTVYRFKDDGRLRYFTNCAGSTMGDVSNGKSRRPDDVPGGYTSQRHQ